MEAGEAEPLDIGSQAQPRNQLNSTRYQAVPGNADPEAVPPMFMEARGRASGYRFPGTA